MTRTADVSTLADTGLMREVGDKVLEIATSRVTVMGGLSLHARAFMRDTTEALQSSADNLDAVLTDVLRFTRSPS